MHAWFKRHSLKLLAIRDTPNAIAGGIAIGFFFGFTPFIGLKTLLALGVAWLCRANILATVVAVTLHDVMLPFMPILFRLEYNIGYWLLSHPHVLPPHMNSRDLNPHQWLSWTTFLNIGKPLVLGSVVFSLPTSILTFFITKGIIVSYRQRHPHPEDSTSVS